MEIQLLKEFVVLSDIRNYARAADELYTTQATLSRHIISMEKELGRELFTRTTRKVELTEFGRGFLVYAKSMVDLWAECMEYTRSETLQTNKIVLALSEAILFNDDIKDAIVSFTLANPECDLELIQDDDEERLIERLKNHDCDLVIIREPEAEEDHMERLMIIPPEPLCVLIGSDHPLAGQDVISMDQLKEEHLILPPSYTYTYKLIMNRCSESGYKPKLRSALRGKDIAAKMVQNKVGLPILSKGPALIASNASGGKVHAIEISPQIMQQVDLIYPSKARRKNSVLTFIKYFRQIISKA